MNDNAEYIRRSVDPILDKLVAAMITDRPEDVMGYMIGFLEKPDPASEQQMSELRERIKMVQGEVEALEARAAAGTTSTEAPAAGAASAAAVVDTASSARAPAEEESIAAKTSESSGAAAPVEDEEPAPSEDIDSGEA
ncbi:unnamed protein product [Amoebophrya sp. A25]|nr:unnamed protein product [Amoebophrya sp. A25]|eukprot:GSA25T00001932001.1